MSLVFSEKIDKKIEDDKVARFWFYAHQEDFNNVDDEGCFTCTISILTKDNVLEGEYYRLFPIRQFKKQHYHKFMEKFCTNNKYREQFNIKLEKEKSSLSNIDTEIKDVIDKLNEIGMKTIHSCQGTKDEFNDRPHISDGHSVTAYIMFKNNLPKEFLEIAKRYDLFLNCNNISIHSLKRKYNCLFHDLMFKIIIDYLKQNPNLKVKK